MTIEAKTEAELTQEEIDELAFMHLESIRRIKIDYTNTEALHRITLANPVFDEVFKVQMLKELWPMLNTVSAPADIIAVKNIGIYREQKVAEIKAMTTLAELEAYDPNWP